jgi:hypothetical protein
VGNLLPYLCSKTNYQPFFTVLSTAIANTFLVISICFMVIGTCLPRFTRQQPVPRRPAAMLKEEDSVDYNPETQDKRASLVE